MKIGIAGIGRMGAAIAERLLKHQHQVTVWNRTRSKAQALAASGAHVADTPRQLAASADIIISILTDAAAITATYDGPEGLLSGDVKGKLFIEMSTVRPATQRALADRIKACHARMIDCPVGGTTGPAREGKLLGLAGWGKHVVRFVGFDAPMPADAVEACVAPAHYPQELKQHARDHRAHALLYYAGYEAAPLEQYVALATMATVLGRLRGLVVLNEGAHASLPLSMLVDIAAEAELTEEARSYLPNLALSNDTGMTAKDDALGQTLLEITGAVTNNGDRVCSRVAVNVVFRDPNGVEIDRQHAAIVDQRSGRLEPGETQEFRMAFDNVPEGWNQAFPSLFISEIRFGGQ